MFTGLASATAAAAFAIGTLAAGAVAAPNPGPPLTTNPDGPQTSNIPYVAWVGEHVRLVACDPAISSERSIQFVNYQIEDWSGYQFQPPNPDGDSGNNLNEAFNPGPAAFFTSSEPAHELSGEEQDGCVATDYKSLNPGLARIRVVVRNQETHQVVFSHQFLVIWLTANKPVLHESAVFSSGSEVFQSELNSTGHANLASFLGDPSGNGVFTPTPFISRLQDDKGLVQIRVTGSFPVVNESPLSNLLASPAYTLPADWATLAGALASSSEETEPPGTEPKLWDIHGTPGGAGEGEETAVNALGDPSKVCKSGFVGAGSSTDNCNGNGEEDPLTSKFSRVFGDLTSGLTATTGPFDPQAANETLLSDGRLNADDAPMPAMRIDVSIAKNAGGSDLGGVGQIDGADKAVIYSHDFTGGTTAHNLYNPYYGAYIPATDRPGVNEVSGIDGPSPGGDFPGFLNEHPEPYTFWDAVQSSNFRRSEPTRCLRRENGEPREYLTPSGPLSRTVYTDERGEAYLTYTPGNQFYLNHLISSAEEEGKIFKNEDGGCDLKGMFEEVIGESSISASAVYPYEPVDYRSQTSETPLVKRVISRWEKEWFEFPKGPGINERSIRIVVAKAQDIDGRPFVGEVVCFVAPNGGVVSHFPGNEVFDGKDQLGFGVRSVIVGPSSIVHPDGKEGKLCETTNENGLVAIEVINSTLDEVDLNVEYVEENIIRDHNVDFTEVVEEKGKKEEEVAKAKEEPATQSLIPPIATTPSTGVAAFTAAKPLTKNQKLHKALNACKKKKPKRVRVACEQKARKAFGAKSKPKPKVDPPAVGLG
jgi:hypothetical protein